VSRVAHRDTLHDLCQWRLGNLQKRMQMVRHPAVGVDAGVKPCEHVRDYLVQGDAIFGRAKECLTMIATEDDVVARARDVQPRWSRHPSTREMN
jgi:hypothetical protein